MGVMLNLEISQVTKCSDCQCLIDVMVLFAALLISEM